MRCLITRLSISRQLRGGETTVANAKLIAAAPELLEACLRARSHLFDAGYEPEEGSMNPNACLLAQLINVIDKALN
ncbi:hypothetical protein CFL29_003765 [Salmonella enterica]|nr:hypothetical protein [Salmonella enterica]